MSFSTEPERQNLFTKQWLLEIIREQGKLATTVYGKHTFRGVYNNFWHFLTSAYQFGMVYNTAQFINLFLFAPIGQNSLRN